MAIDRAALVAGGIRLASGGADAATSWAVPACIAN